MRHESVRRTRDWLAPRHNKVPPGPSNVRGTLPLKLPEAPNETGKRTIVIALILKKLTLELQYSPVPNTYFSKDLSAATLLRS